MKFMVEPVSNRARQRTGWILWFRILTRAVVNRSLDGVMFRELVSLVAPARLSHCLFCRCELDDGLFEWYDGAFLVLGGVVGGV